MRRWKLRGGVKMKRPHHALHAMRQQQHDTVLSDPLGLARGDELVDDGLSCVMKVSKLSLPEHKSIRTRHGKAKLKPCTQ